MITIGEEVLLLALDYDTGSMNFRIPDRALRCAVGGAVLTDLALAGRIDTDTEALFVTDPAPLGEPAQDRALARIAADGGRRSPDDWVLHLAEDFDALRASLTERLEARGFLLRGPYDRIWIVGARHCADQEGQPLRDVRQRLAGELMSSEIPDPRDIAIIGIVEACNLWCGLMEQATLAYLRPRIDLFARMDLVCHAVARVAGDEAVPIQAECEMPVRPVQVRHALFGQARSVGLRLASGGRSS